MLKEFTDIVKKITFWKVIGAYMVTFLLVAFFPFKFFPDYLLIGNVPAKKDVLFKLLSTTIGFSGLILTVLLVAYNFFIKTIKRNTLEFVTNNLWLKLIFSCFFGNVLFLGIGFFVIETGLIDDITILYFSYIITLIFILSLFPLAILSLNDTISLKKIDKLLRDIKDDDINELINSNFDELTWHHKIERNPILILRDIGTNAVTDKDWILPQTILNGLFKLLILSLDNKSSRLTVERNIFVWALCCNYIKREIVKQNDIITGSTLLFLNLEAAHEHFINNNIIEIRSNGIDNFLKDFLETIIETNSFSEMQSHFPVRITELIKLHFSKIKYSDEETRTTNYIMESNADVKFEMTAIKNHWFYLTHDLLDIIFDVVESAIDSKRKSVYENFASNIQGLILEIGSSRNNLTNFQKVDVLEEILRVSERIIDYSIEKGIYNRIDSISEIVIATLFEIQNNLGFHGIQINTRMIKNLYKKNALSSFNIYNYFMIIRYLSPIKIEPLVLNQAIQIIVDVALKIVQDSNISNETRNDFLYNLNWLYKDYLNKFDPLRPSETKYSKVLAEILKNYDYQDIV
jgi:hypothetical protein